MPPVYKMVFVNVIASLILFSLFFMYKFLLKKNISYPVILILISLLPLISIARPGVYESGDFIIHAYRSISFYASLSEGILMPSWAGEVNSRYGLPLFIFNYTLPYYGVSLLHFLGFSITDSLKIFLSATYVFSGIFMFIFTKRLFKNDLAAFTSSVFYLFVPYHLIDMHFKTVVGEHLAFTILPLMFYFILKISDKSGKITATILAGLSFAALINSHVFIALVAALIAIPFSLITFSSLRKIILVLVSLAIGAVISSYIWLSPFLLGQYTIIQKTPLNFIPLENIHTLFFTPWRFGFLFQGPNGEIAYIIGYVQLFVVFYLSYVFLAKKIKKKTAVHISFWLITFFLLYLLILPASRPVWEIAPFIKAVGQHRLLLTIAFTTSVLAGYLALNLSNRKIIYVLIFVAIFSTILNWGNRRTIPEISDSILKENLPKSTYNLDTHFYSNSRWVDPNNPWFRNPPLENLEVINGKGIAESKLRNSVIHTYKVDAETPLRVQENTLYFPGWSAEADGKPVPVYPSDKGVIQMNLPYGIYDLTLKYEDIFPLKLLKIISLTSILICFIFIFIKTGLAYLKRHKVS